MLRLTKIWTCCFQFCFIFAIVGAPLVCPNLAEAQALKEITITSFGISPATVLHFYARDRKFFQDEGLDVKMSFVAPEAAVAALVAGDADYTTMAVTAMEATLKGFPLMTFALTPRDLAWSLVVHKGIKEIRDLKGKRLATDTYGGLVHSVAIDMLRHYGLDPKDIEIRPMGGPPAPRVAAMVNGAVDATIVATPVDIQLEQKGFKILLDVASVFKMPAGGMSTSIAKIQKNRDEVKKVFNIIVRATKSFTDAQNKTEVINYIKDNFKVEESVATKAYPKLVATFSPAGMVDIATVQDIIDRAIKLSPKDKRLDPEVVVDFSFARELGFQEKK